jgi:hypothetical protein
MRSIGILALTLFGAGCIVSTEGLSDGASDNLPVADTNAGQVGSPEHADPTPADASALDPLDASSPIDGAAPPPAKDASTLPSKDGSTPSSCGALDVACGGAATCCAGLFCDPGPMRCRVCQGSGRSCNADAECCTGSCVSGVCK